MNSKDLADYGFGAWLPFYLDGEAYLLARLPNEPGVYAVRSKRALARLRGESDLLYVGKAARVSVAKPSGLKLRIRQYYHPGWLQETSKRIRSLIASSNDYEIGWAVTPSKKQAQDLESALLNRYVREHGELTPENRNMPRI